MTLGFADPANPCAYPLVIFFNSKFFRFFILSYFFISNMYTIIFTNQFFEEIFKSPQKKKVLEKFLKNSK